MSDYFYKVKPVLNRLCNHDIIKNLYTIRFFIRKRFKSVVDTVDPYYEIESPNYNIIPPYLADFLIINTLKYGCINNASNSLYSFKERTKILSILENVQNEVNKIPMRDDVATWLKSFIFNQEKMQLGEDIRSTYCRYYKIYNNEKIIKTIKNKYGTDLDEYMAMTIMLFIKFDQQFSIDFGHLKNSFKGDTRFGKIDIERFCNDIVIDINDIHNYYKNEKQLYNEENIFYSYLDDLHVSHPLIAHNNQWLCINPVQLLHVLLGRIYYDLSDEIHIDLGSQLEEYVNAQLSYYFSKQFDASSGYIREFEYNTKDGKKKTSDFIIWNKDKIVFLDCKMKKITEPGKRNQFLDMDFIDTLLQSDWYKRKEWENNVSQNIYINEYTKDILEIAKGIGKIYRCYDDYTKGLIKLPNESGESKELTVVLLSLNSLHVGLNYDLISKIAEWYRTKNGKDNRKCSFKEISIISSIDFDHIVPCIETEGIERFINGLSWCNNDRSENTFDNPYIRNMFDQFVNNQLKEVML